jgi:hypothetical protein
MAVSIGRRNKHFSVRKFIINYFTQTRRRGTNKERITNDPSGRAAGETEKGSETLTGIDLGQYEISRAD